MSNREPTTELLRLRDVTAWLPRLTRDTLEAMDEQARKDGQPISSQPTGPKGRRYYLKTPLKKRLGIG